MANGGNSKTKAHLLDEIDQLQQENADLQSALDAVYDIIAPPDEEDEEDEDDDVDGDDPD
jgi:hypothetical protein